jgi:uncharacterized protein YegL
MRRATRSRKPKEILSIYAKAARRYFRSLARRYMLYSAAISLLLHAVFFSCSAFVKMPGIKSIAEDSKKFFNIKSLEIPIAKPVRKRGVTYAQRLQFKSPRSSEALSSYSDSKQESHHFDIKQEAVGSPLDAKNDSRQDEAIMQRADYAAVDKKDPRKTRKDLIEVGEVSDSQLLVMPDDVASAPAIDEDFLNKMPGFTPRVTGGFLDSARQGLISKLTNRYTPTIKRKSKLKDLNEYLICELSVYKDPVTSEKYYKVSIRSGRDADKLAVLPKEVVFLIDCSLSIQQKRLKEFKDGLRYCLTNLNDDDYFNIMAFKEYTTWFNKDSVKPTIENIEKALRFVDRLSAGEGTDAYKALYKSIKEPQTMTPSYIILYSDGRPTHGITDSVRIINEISSTNKGNRPIFAFSGGSRVNRYFLDFISYKNRGWTEYANRTRLIGNKIEDMYNKIKDPMLLNLRYRISGLDESQVFPKALPDFYKNAEFTLYGKYNEDKEFSLQLLGDTKDETNEFIIVGSLEKAARGNKDIARNWAFNKIYYLIGLLEHDRENEDILNQINDLCGRFDINTPYTVYTKEKR